MNLTKTNEVHKYFDRIRKEENVNEYNRTEVEERETGKRKGDNPFLEKHGIKVVDKIDSNCNPCSYISKVKSKNQD